MLTKLLTVLSLSLTPAAMAQSLDASIAGRWDATIHINGVETPFPLEISGSGANVTAYFFNGDDRYASTEGRLENGKLALKWDYYESTLQAPSKTEFWKGNTPAHGS